MIELLRELMEPEIQDILKEIEKHEIISFDIFNTLLLSPFASYEKMFVLLGREFDKSNKRNIDFANIRIDGERGLKEKNKLRDKEQQSLNLDSIYSYISDMYKLTDSICSQMKEREKELVLKYFCTRKTGKYLFNVAVQQQKKIIICTDTVYGASTVAELLRKNGFNSYEEIFVSSEMNETKTGGGLYNKVIQKYKVEPNKILHIGGHWDADIVQPKRVGMDVHQFPDTMDVFLDLNRQYETNRCGHIAEKVCNSFINYENIKNSMGYSCMMALVANKYFDNPFRKFVSQSDFNQDPYFMGYYVLGMHLVGLIKWIEQIVKGRYRKIWFTSRDGWLLMNTYNSFKDIRGDMPPCDYLYLSRRSMLPWMILDKSDLFDLPINIFKYTPEQMIELLNFCVNDEKRNVFIEKLKEVGIFICDKFSSMYQFHMFINLFIDNCYDERRHQKERKNITNYLKEIEDNDIIFDMGYSARIHKAVCDAIGKTPAALFVHSDDTKHYRMQRLGGFQIYEFYNYVPIISAAFREFMLSQCGASCIAYDREGIPIFEEEEISSEQKSLVEKMHQGAIDFARDFVQKFADDWELISLKSQEVSMPFEGFLRYISQKDREILNVVKFEDKVWGAEKGYNLKKLTEEEVKWLPKYDY